MYLDEGVLDDFLGVLAVIEYLVGEAVGQRVKLNHQRPKVIPASLDDAVRTVVYLTDIQEFGAMNEVYAQYLKVDPPGRTTVAVTALPAGAQVEIELTAVLPDA